MQLDLGMEEVRARRERASGSHRRGCMDALREGTLQWLAEEHEALDRHMEATREVRAQHKSRSKGNPLLQNFLGAADRLDE